MDTVRHYILLDIRTYPYCQTKYTVYFTHMARHKSEITGSPLKIATRVTFDQWLEFRKLGGSVWLRNLLKNSMENRKSQLKEKT